MGFAATRYGNNLGYPPRIFLNGVQSNLAHEQSITATPCSVTRQWSSGDTHSSPTGLSTRPWNFWDSLRERTKPSLASFLPEHFLGSQCSRSWKVNIEYWEPFLCNKLPPLSLHPIHKLQLFIQYLTRRDYNQKYSLLV